LNPYATNKLAFYPEVVQQLRENTWEGLLTVHLMPQNLCNQNCEFCSYRMDGNKNALAIDYSKHLPEDCLGILFEDFKALGVKGIEITGGGEPLAYPHINKIFELAERYDIRIGLVTNGTLLKKADIELIGRNLSWARVSIDAATKETYSSLRNCPMKHFEKAWEAVGLLREASTRPEFRLGVSFVLSNTNHDEIMDFVELTATHGAADNVRLSSTYSDDDSNYWTEGMDLDGAVVESELATEEFNRDGFTVHNMIPDRVWENEHSHQDYDECYTKDLLCVVEGEGKVYTCCTFTGSNKGILGNILEHPRGLRGVWEDKLEWRRKMKACHYCDCSCLYRQRNLDMIDLVRGTQIHKEFI
jgi:radical SAM protein with 4Fe4S-binding SPASM domain